MPSVGMVFLSRLRTINQKATFSMAEANFLRCLTFEHPRVDWIETKQSISIQLSHILRPSDKQTGEGVEDHHRRHYHHRYRHRHRHHRCHHHHHHHHIVITTFDVAIVAKFKSSGDKKLIRNVMEKGAQNEKNNEF